MKKLFLMFLSLAIVLSLALPVSALTSVAVKGIKLDKSSVTLDIGSTYSLKVAFTPSNTTQKLLKYSTSDKNVAAVDANGKVTAVAAGTAVIMAVSSVNSKITGKCTVTVTPKTLFKTPVTLTTMTASNASFPYDPDWYVWKLIQQETNVKLDVQAVPDTDFDNKVALTLASGSAPDILFINNPALRDKFATSGAFTDITANFNGSNFPNLYAYYNASKNNAMWVKRFYSGDGRLYCIPNYGVGETNRKLFMYRDDIFTANNLSVPKSYNALYDDAKILKKKYPDSYPFTVRVMVPPSVGNGGNLDVLASQWSSGYPYFFDTKTSKWVFGPSTQGFEGMVAWLHRMYAEKLVPEDIAYEDTAPWTQLLSTGKSFITMDYIGRVDSFTAAVQAKEPNGVFKFMPPPAGMINGQAKMEFVAYGLISGCIFSGSKKEKEAMKFLDWMWSDKATQLLTWGEEGKTYTVQDGLKKYNYPDKTSDYRKLWGLGTQGAYLTIDYAGILKSTGSKNLIEALNLGPKYDAPMQPVAAFNNSESSILSNEGATIQTKANEEISKFIMGKRDMGDWSQFLSEMKALGLDKLTAAYNDTYARIR